MLATRTAIVVSRFDAHDYASRHAVGKPSTFTK